VAYKDGGIFESYCDKPYDRHTYKLNLTNGKAIVLEDYDQVRAFWYRYRQQLKSVEVLG
jgi:hypothetical protein